MLFMYLSKYFKENKSETNKTKLTNVDNSETYQLHFTTKYYLSQPVKWIE